MHAVLTNCISNFMAGILQWTVFSTAIEVAGKFRCVHKSLNPKPYISSRELKTVWKREISQISHPVGPVKWRLFRRSAEIYDDGRSSPLRYYNKSKMRYYVVPEVFKEQIIFVVASIMNMQSIPTVLSELIYLPFFFFFFAGNYLKVWSYCTLLW